MMFPTLFGLLGALALAPSMGCSSTKKQGAPGDEAAPTQQGTPEEIAPFFAPDGKLSCTTKADCPEGLACVGNVCQGDPCAEAAAQGLCVDPKVCRASCEIQTDACEGVTCPSGQSCFGGTCIPGCFPPSRCVGVRCGADEYCDPVKAACAKLQPCSAKCPSGRACNLACVTPPPADPCAGVTCASNEICVGGGCVTNLCANVTCAAGELCVNGSCIKTCNCPNCTGGNASCQLGVCQCTPACDGKACGADNGCGGGCNAPCGAGKICAAGSGGSRSCVCSPTCPANAVCGASDGCGGKCNGSCADVSGQPQQCNGSRVCVCKPTCPANAVCGASDGCGGKCNGSCSGGFGCSAQKTCVANPCSPACGPGQACVAGTCVDTCPPDRACGAVCCPVGRVCLNPASGSCSGLI